MGKVVGTKFRYSKREGLQDVFIKIKIKKCSRAFLWYENRIGEEFDAELKEDKYYILFFKDAQKQQGGLVELTDAEIIPKNK